MQIRTWLLAGTLALAAAPAMARGFGQAIAADLPALFAQADANGDGKLSLDEYKTFRELVAEKRTEAQFQRLDTAGAGTVTLDQIQAAIASHQGRHQGCTGNKAQ
jgi:hypothetical protein